MEELEQEEVDNKLVSIDTDSMGVLVHMHEEVSGVLILLEVLHVVSTCLHNNQSSFLAKEHQG